MQLMFLREMLEEDSLGCLVKLRSLDDAREDHADHACPIMPLIEKRQREVTQNLARIERARWETRKSSAVVTLTIGGVA